jgi:hypothetical protein
MKLTPKEKQIIELSRLVSKSIYNDDEEYRDFYDLEILRLKHIFLNHKQFKLFNFKLTLEEVFPNG